MTTVCRKYLFTASDCENKLRRPVRVLVAPNLYGEGDNGMVQVASSRSGGTIKLMGRQRSRWVLSLSSIFGVARIALLVQAFVASFVWSHGSEAQPAGSGRDPLVLLWSKPIASGPSDGAPSGLVLMDILRSSDGPAVLLASDAGRPGLLLRPNEGGPGSLTYLPLTGNHLRICGGVGETLWIGGVAKERYAGIGSAQMTDGYLAKVDRSGRIFWEQSFGGHSLRTIESLASLPSGDVVVAGRDDERTWLARVSSDGKIVWERFVGSGKGAAVTTIGDRIFLTAFESNTGSAAKSFSEDVAFWSFDETGELRDHHIVREGVNRERGAHFGKLSIERSSDSIYVLSAWLDFVSAKAVEVTKLDLQGQVAWRKELPETLLNLPNALHLPNEPQVVTWPSGITVAPKKGLTIALPVKGRLAVLRFDEITGAFLERIITPGPDCYRNGATTLFLSQNADQDIWIFGSYQKESSAAGCIWLGQISL
jgi:PQQ-like domain